MTITFDVNMYKVFDDFKQLEKDRDAWEKDAEFYAREAQLNQEKSERYAQDYVDAANRNLELAAEITVLTDRQNDAKKAEKVFTSTLLMFSKRIDELQEEVRSLNAEADATAQVLVSQASEVELLGVIRGLIDRPVGHATANVYGSCDAYGYPLQLQSGDELYEPFFSEE